MGKKEDSSKIDNDVYGKKNKNSSSDFTKDCTYENLSSAFTKD